MAAAKLWVAASSPDTVSEDDAGTITITINHNLQLRSSTPKQLNLYFRQHEKMCGPATPVADGSPALYTSMAILFCLFA